MQGVFHRRCGQRRIALAGTPVHQHRGKQHRDARGLGVDDRQHTRRTDGGLQPDDFHARPEKGACRTGKEEEPPCQHPQSIEPDGRGGHQAGAGRGGEGKQAACLYALQPHGVLRQRHRPAEAHQLLGEQLRQARHPHQQAGVQPAGAVRGFVSRQLLRHEPGLRPLPHPRRRGRLPDVQGAHPAQRGHPAEDILHRPARRARGHRHYWQGRAQ